MKLQINKQLILEASRNSHRIMEKALSGTYDNVSIDKKKDVVGAIKTNQKQMNKKPLEEGVGTVATIGGVGAMTYGAKKGLDSLFKKTDAHNEALNDAIDNMH